MKWKKLVSGVLAASMVLTSAAWMPQQVSAASEEPIKVSEIHYTAPAVGGKPQQVRAVIDKSLPEITDRAVTAPAPLEAVNGSTLTKEQTTEDTGARQVVYGFHQQLKSNAEKFNAKGHTQILLSFRLFAKSLPESGYVSLISKGDQYGIQLMPNGLRLFLTNQQGNLVSQEYTSCFGNGLNRWYDVIVAIDARNAGASRIFVNGKASAMVSHRGVGETNAPFALDCKVKDSDVSETVSADQALLADVKFYNYEELSAEDQTLFANTLRLKALNILSDNGWSDLSNLVNKVDPTAYFSVRPYDMKTVWKNENGDEVEGAFLCGNTYKAETTFTAVDGYTFTGNTLTGDDATQLINGYVYEKMNLTGCGTADSEFSGNESGNVGSGPASAAVDGNETTYWHTAYNSVNLTNNTKNHYVITLPEKTLIGQFRHLTRQNSDGIANGTIRKINLEYKASDDATEWTPLKSEIEFPRDKNWDTVEFDPVEVKQVRITVTGLHVGTNNINAAEFELYKVIPQTTDDSKIEVGTDGKTMKITAIYNSIACTSHIDYVQFDSRVVVQKNATYQINKNIYAADGRLVEEHKELLEQSKNISYSYTAKTADGTADTDVITVSSTGEIKAVKPGNAVIIATATLNGENLADYTIPVQVLDGYKELAAPTIKYASPTVEEHPGIPSVRLRREDDQLDADMVVDMSEGGSSILEPVDWGADAKAGIKVEDNVTGFAKGYTASGTDQQFNVTGEHPMVVSLKLFLKKLPTDNAEHTIVSKGNQYNFFVKKNGDNAQLRFTVTTGSNTWPYWSYNIDESFVGKWHDIVVVADGKGKMGFFVDEEFSTENGVSGPVYISEKDWISSGETTTLRPFTVCDKVGETTSMKFTLDDGLLADVKFYNIDMVDSTGALANQINLETLLASGVEHNHSHAMVLRRILENVKATANVTARPYLAETKWSIFNERNEESEVNALSIFTRQEILTSRYRVETTLKPYSGFAFNFSNAELAQVKDWITLDPELADDMYECSAFINSEGALVIRVDFYPAGIPAQQFTYLSPAEGRTTREEPQYDRIEVPKYMTVAPTVWLKNGTTEIGANEAFAKITKENWYMARTVLTAKNSYLFDGSDAYIDQVKDRLIPQRSGNVEVEKNVIVSDDGKTMTIELSYKTAIYQVTFDMDGGTVNGSSVQAQSVSEGNTAVKPDDPVKANSTFLGWYVGDNEYNFTTKVTGNITLTAKWMAAHTVTFHPGLADMANIVVTTGKDGKVKEQTIRTGKNITFEGWFGKKADGTWEAAAFDFDTVLNKDVDLYAKWSAEVIFMNGTEKVKEIKVEAGKAADASQWPENPEKTGYTFAGWYAETGEEEKEKYENSTPIEENVVLYAEWEAIEYTVDYDLKGGKWPESLSPAAPKSIKHGEVLRYTQPEKAEGESDPNFAGWYTDENCTDGNRYDFAPATGNIKLYAKWVSGTVHTVKYEAGEGVSGATITPSEVKIVDGNTVIVKPQVQREHYEVEGWYTDAACSDGKKFEFGAAGAGTPITANITLYAKWKLKKYTVTFNSNGGSEVASIEVDAMGTIAEKDAPTPTHDNESLVFDGWYQTALLRNKFVFGEGEGATKILRDTTLFARWIIPVTGITVTPATATMEVDGEDLQLTAKVAPVDATDRKVTWSSSNEEIATVDDGFVTAVSAGEVIITASIGEIKGSATITVTGGSTVKKRKIGVQPDPNSNGIGWLDFTIKGWNSDRNSAYTGTNRPSFAVGRGRRADATYGPVGEYLLVTAGASSGDDSSLALLQFDLSEITRTEINAMEKAELRLYFIGRRNEFTGNTLVAAVVPEASGLTDLTELKNANGTWNATWSMVSSKVGTWLSASSNNRFVKAGESEPYDSFGDRTDMGRAKPSENSVYINIDITDALKNAYNRNRNGKLILAVNETKGSSDADGAEHYFVRTMGAIGAGKFDNAKDDMAPSITFTYEGETATGIEIQNKDAIPALTAPGATAQLTAKIIPETAQEANTVKWTSSKPAVATVDENGLVTAVATGTTTITAAVEGTNYSDTVEIEVNIPCTCEIGTLTVSGGDEINIRSSEDKGTLQLIPSVTVGGSCQITGHPAGNTVTYTYAVGDTNTAGASVNAETGLVTATQTGTVDVTVTAAIEKGAEGKKVATETVTITVTKLAEGQYEVAYHANATGVTGMPATTVVTADTGYEIEKPADPSRSGYEFVGWSTEADGTAIVTWPYTVETDTDFYAVWRDTSGITDAAAKAALAEAIANAKGYYEGPDIYTDATWNPFTGAYKNATGNIEGLTPAQIMQLADNLNNTRTALAADEDKLLDAIGKILAEVGAEINGGNDKYTQETWDAYKNAYQLLKDTAEEGATVDRLLELYLGLIGTDGAKIKLSIDAEWVAAKAALNQALNGAAAIIKNGASMYDAGKWNAFKAAYDAADKQKNAKVGSITAAELKKLADALNAAAKDIASLQKGDYVDKNGVRYVVIDAAAKKVSAEGIAAQKKKLKKAVILPTVTIKGVSCTVTEVKAKGFAKFAKLKKVTIGANIEVIGKQAFKGCKKLKNVIFKGKKVPTMKKSFKGTPSNMKVKLSKALKKGKVKKNMIKKLRKAGVSSKAKIK